MIRWPHQIYAVDQVTKSAKAGGRRICLTSPTGGGKSLIMADLIESAELKQSLAHPGRVLYTNRTMLLEQTERYLINHGIYPGLRASRKETALLRDVQLAMIQTEWSQVFVNKNRELHRAGLVFIDEAHSHKGEVMQAITRWHLDDGAVIVLVTATPLDLGGYADELIQAGVNSDLFRCGALVPAHTYGPDEPELSSIKRVKVGEDLSDAENVKAMMRPGIFGRVYDNWRTLNRDGLPTILFAPGVKESLWFAEQFGMKGVRAAHIDGEDIWLDGEFYKTDGPENMKDVLAAGSKAGEIQVVCNRFVLREGIDWPWLRHGIFATVVGSLTSFLQMGGRLLRAYPGKQFAIVQDHGGSWWRHGSLNADRDWTLGETNHQLCADRIEKLRQKPEHEPIVCPNCGKVRPSGNTCHACGHVAHKKSRMVVQSNGTLKPMRGDILKPRKVKTEPNTADLWKKMYYRAKNSKTGMTFRQAEALFNREHGYWPERSLAYMPTSESGWGRRVKDVQWSELIHPQQESRSEPLFS